MPPTPERGKEPPRRGPRLVKSVEHAVDVLEYMARVARPVGVSDVARQTGLSKAAVHHLLATLMARRLVIQESDSSRYRLSWALYELGASVVRDLELSRAARPHLDRLAAMTGQFVLLGILDEDAVLYLDRGEGPAGLLMVANTGRRGPLHATASGKVLLAFAGEGRVVQELLNRPLPRYTPMTVTEPHGLRRQLAAVRTRGYAACWEEREVGLCSVAVPIRDYTRRVVGSLALAAPSSRLTPRNVQQHLAPLQQVARLIEVRTAVKPGGTVGQTRGG